MTATNSELPKSHCKPELGKEKPRGAHLVWVQWGPGKNEEANEDCKQGKLTQTCWVIGKEPKQVKDNKICLYVQGIDAKMQIFTKMTNS